MTSKRLIKPTKRSEWRGQKGNKFRVYIVRVDGKDYNHVENKRARDLQYDSAVRVYNMRKSRRK